MSLLDRSLNGWSLGEVRSRRRRLRQRPRGVPTLESLEVRVVPAASMWTGLGTTANWSDAGNWQGDVVPAPGNDLDFPSGAANLTNNNDLGNVTYGALDISGSGYSIGGGASTFTSIDASQPSGSSTVDLPITLSGAATVTVDTSGSTLVIGGVISGTAGLTQTGAGTLNLTAANTYTGTTSLNGGTLVVDGSQGGSPIAAGTGTNLGGVGTVGAITTARTTVSPGDSAPGILIDTGALNLGLDSSSNPSAYNVELDGSTPGNGANHYSQTQVNGVISLDNSILNLTLGPDFTASVPTVFTIIDNTGSQPVTGTFSGLAQGSTLLISGVTFAVSYDGGPSSNSVVLTELDPSTSSVTASPTSSVYGQSVALTATVTGPNGDPTPTGNVEFFSGTTLLGSGTLASGTASLNTSAIPVGDNSITIQYQGDGNYAGSTSPALPFTVGQSMTSTAVSAFPVSPTSGETVTLTATVSATSPGTGTPAGSVQFFNGSSSLGTSTITNGVATLTTSALTVGSNSVTADYLGNTNYSTSTSPAVSVTVASTATSTTTLTFSPNSPVYGQNVTLTATVAPTTSGTPTGTVQFFNNSKLLGTGNLTNGVATYSATGLALGSNSLTAVYSGDSNFTSSTSTAVPVTVQQASSSTAVTYFPVSPVAGQSVTLTATVSAASPGSGTPTGTVQFLNGTDVLGTSNLTNGVATFTATTLATGSNSITAQYLGDSNFTGGTSPTVTVTLAATPTSTTTVTYTPSSPVYGNSVTLTATVASTTTGTPTGTVQFFNGTTSLGTATLSSGTATLAPTVLPTGANSVTAVYSGDSNFTASTSPVVTVTVAQISTSTVLTYTPSNPSYGQSVTLTATITPSTTGPAAPTGAVTFYNGTTSLGTGTISNDVATLNTTSIPAGTNSLTAVYGGDTNYATSTSPAVSVPVTTTASTTTVTVFPISPVSGQNITFSATVASTISGSPNPTGSVQFFNGSTLLGTGTLSGGVATFMTTSLTTGTYSITAKYLGDSNFTGSTSPVVNVTVAATANSTTTVTFSPSAPSYGTSVTLTATVAASGTGTGTPTGSVNFYNGTTLLGSGTVNSGVATLVTTTLPVGTNAITAQYSGDTNFTSSTSAVVNVKVTQIATTTALTFSPTSPTVGASVTFTATITPVNTGTATPSGTVEFLNGTTVLGTGTVANNVATFTTSSLPAGTNSITAQYLGDTNYAASTSSVVPVTVSEFLAVTYSPNLPVFGQSATLVATLSPTGTATPTGTVQFYVGATLLGSATVANDTATITTSALNVGNNSVTAVYSGDTNYPASTSGVELVPVALASTTTTLYLSDSNPYPGEMVTILAAVAPVSPGGGTLTGTVQFYDNNIYIGSGAVSNGAATYNTMLPVGPNSITAIYSGDPHFEGSAAIAATATGGSASDLLLNQIYRVELGRAPTQAEYTYYDTQFAKKRSVKSVVNSIAKSAEAKNYSVVTAYQDYLKTTPTPAEINVIKRKARSTHTSVRAAILGSPAYYLQSGGSLDAYLTSLELAVLGKSVNTASYKRELASGKSHTAVAQQMLQTNLGKQNLYISSYVTVFGYPPSYQNIRQGVGLNSNAVTASLLASPEFYDTVTASA